MFTLKADFMSTLTSTPKLTIEVEEKRKDGTTETFISDNTYPGLRPLDPKRAEDFVQITPGPYTYGLGMGPVIQVRTLNQDAHEAIEHCIARGSKTEFAKTHKGWVLSDIPDFIPEKDFDVMKDFLPSHGYELARLRDILGDGETTSFDTNHMVLRSLDFCACGKPMHLAHGHE